VQELLASVRDVLERAGISNARREAEWIVEAATGLDRPALASSSAEATPEQTETALSLARRRAGGEPLQYVTGIAGFRRLDLEVGPGVFIPRPETELVAEIAMELIPHGGTVVEVGTGSGALILSIVDERPDVRAWATEYSEDARAWAVRNRDRLGLEVSIVGGDLFEDLPAELKGSVDVIVSNPPYIPEGFQLAREVVDFEPHIALFADDAGMGFIRRMADESPQWLKPGGRLVFEIGEVQRDASKDLLEDLGYADVEVLLDMSERPRIVRSVWGSSS
jgi:release factor glutamine methyltransferase